MLDDFIYFEQTRRERFKGHSFNIFRWNEINFRQLFDVSFMEQKQEQFLKHIFKHNPFLKLNLCSEYDVLVN